MHASYGLGAVAGPLLVTALLGNGISWRWTYGTMAMALTVLSWVFALVRRRWETLARPVAPTLSRPDEDLSESSGGTGRRQPTDGGRPQRPDLRCRRDRHRVRSRHLGLRVPDNWTWPVSRGRWGSRLGVLGDDVRRAGCARSGCGACRTSPCPWRRGCGRDPRRRAHVDARPGLCRCHRHDDHRLGRRTDLPPAHPHNSAEGLVPADTRGTTRTVSLQVAASAVGSRRATGRHRARHRSFNARVLAPSLLVLGLAMCGVYRLMSHLGRPAAT